MENNEHIKALRRQIDGCDELMFEALNSRFFYVKKIGKIKKKMNLPVVDKQRFEEMVDKKVKKYKSSVDNLSEDFIRKLYDLIHEESCKIQNENK